MVGPVDRPRQRGIGQRARLRQRHRKLAREIRLDPHEFARRQRRTHRDVTDQRNSLGRVFGKDVD
jgi:hypothetical protein